MHGRVHTADAVVIGAGLHGCATALHLTRAGLDAMVIEKDYVGRHASSTNAGGVRRLGRAFPEIPLADAALEVWHHIRDLVDDDCGFARSCQVKVAESESELQALRERRAAVLELGFDHEEIIDHAELRALLPSLAPHCVGGMVVHGDGHANPFLTVRAFHRKAAALGVRFFEHTPVESLERVADTWRLRSSGSRFEAPILVNCAGIAPAARVVGREIGVDHPFAHHRFGEDQATHRLHRQQRCKDDAAGGARDDGGVLVLHLVGMSES